CLFQKPDCERGRLRATGAQASRLPGIASKLFAGKRDACAPVDALSDGRASDTPMTKAGRSVTMQALRSFKKTLRKNDDEYLFIAIAAPSIPINPRNLSHHCREFVRIRATIQSGTF